MLESHEYTADAQTLIQRLKDLPRWYVLVRENPNEEPYMADLSPEERAHNRNVPLLVHWSPTVLEPSTHYQRSPRCYQVPVIPLAPLRTPKPTTSRT
jgi:hypothetical protein